MVIVVVVAFVLFVIPLAPDVTESLNGFVNGSRILDSKASFIDAGSTDHSSMQKKISR